MSLVIQLRIDARGTNVPTIVREDCQKAADRIESIEAALHKAFNQFENITVADTLEIAKDRAHSFIGWYYANVESVDGSARTSGAES